MLSYHEHKLSHTYTWIDVVHSQIPFVILQLGMEVLGVPVRECFCFIVIILLHIFDLL